VLLEVGFELDDGSDEESTSPFPVVYTEKKPLPPPITDASVRLEWKALWGRLKLTLDLAESCTTDITLGIVDFAAGWR
jgi:hypothetical protein